MLKLQSAALFALLMSTHLSWLPAEDPISFSAPPIQVPAGFIVETAAAPPLVEHPMMAGFDDRGRLYIAESAGRNLKRAELEAELPNFIRMLEDTDGDGRFDKSTIFADKLTFPMGAVWHQGWLYVASSGGIWRFQDTDDDGVADVRELIVDQFGYTGNAADVHGCFVGPEGRIYWCEGRHGHEFRGDGGHVVSQGKAARIFSCRPDGSDVRIHCGGGMDNPVEIDFTDEGEMLGTVNLLYRQRGDCLVHWMHGGVYPRFDQPQVVAEFKRSGDLLTPVIDLGHVAVSGTTRYRDSRLGEQFRDTFFVTEFNTHKVVCVRLTRSGATFTATAEDFLVSSSADFHPTDVFEDADGSLLVIDTGGWFRNGCPTSQIEKPNILGAIYRIRRADAPPMRDPRGTEIDWSSPPSEFVQYLDDDRFAVRERAIRTLGSHGTRAVAFLEQTASLSANVTARRNAVWALARIEDEAARAAVRSRLSDADDSVRQAAVFCVGASRDGDAVPRLVELLGDSSFAVRRQAATSLGKIGEAAAVPGILKALESDSLDRVHEHALIFALIDTNSRSAALAGLTATSPRVQRAALMALDQMDAGALAREEVTSLLGTADLALQHAALEVIARHPEWSEGIVELVQPLLIDAQADETRMHSLRTLLTAFAGDEHVQSFVAGAVVDADLPDASRLMLLDVMRDGSLPELPASWIAQAQRLLTCDVAHVAERALGIAERYPSTELREALWQLARYEKQPAELRVRALAVCAEQAEVDDETFAFLMAQRTDDVSVTRRLAAARALGAAALSAMQLERVTEWVERAGPLELPCLLDAYESCSDASVGRQLVQALSKAPGLPSLSAVSLAGVLERFPSEIREAATSLRQQLTPTDAEQSQRLAELEAAMDGGDPRRGEAVFAGQRAACVTCHASRGRGGRIGPDLSTIGTRRDTRDLLEAVLYPSSSLARGFESFTVLTTDGRVLTGLIVSETADALRLRTTEQTEVVLRRAAIEELHPSPTSIMPTGLDRTISRDELRDLLAYLNSLK